MLVQLHISWQITHFLNSLITHRFCIKKQRTKSEFPRYQSYYDLNWFEKRHFKTRRVFIIAHSNTFHHQLDKKVWNNWLPNLHFKVAPMSTFLNQFICSHSFTNLSTKCLCDTLIIHIRKNMHLFQLRQFASNFLRNKNNSSVTFVLTKQTGQVCRQSSDKATSKTPLQDLNFLNHEMAGLLSCPSACSPSFQ